MRVNKNGVLKLKLKRSLTGMCRDERLQRKLVIVPGRSFILRDKSTLSVAIELQSSTQLPTIMNTDATDKFSKQRRSLLRLLKPRIQCLMKRHCSETIFTWSIVGPSYLAYVYVSKEVKAVGPILTSRQVPKKT